MTKQNQTIQKSVEEIRDELAKGMTGSIRYFFCLGFDSGLRIGRKEACELVEAFEDLIERHCYSGEDEWHIKALASYKRKVGK